MVSDNLLVKILGSIDVFAAIVLLTLIVETEGFFVFLDFAAILLFVKGLFAFTGDLLSYIDLFSALLLSLSLFFSPPSFLLWISFFLLLAKGVTSFG